jgi:hypothetical protein
MANSATIFQGWIFDMVQDWIEPRRPARRQGVKERILRIPENCGKSPPPNR